MFNVIKKMLINSVFFAFRYSYMSYVYITWNAKYIKKGLRYIGMLPHYNKEVCECYNEKVYDLFKVYSYRFVKDDCEYFFDYIIRNVCEDKDKLLEKMLKDTYSNILEKDNNKELFLYMSIVLSDETILCCILNEINKLRYHFDSVDKDTLLYWSDIYEIIKEKYTNNIDEDIKLNRLGYLNDINNLYIYMILNDAELSEKTVLLSSVMDKIICYT